MILNENELLSCKVFHIMGFDYIDIKHEHRKLINQKIVYLLQNHGLSLGYGYEYMVRGPYSFKLAFIISRITLEIFDRGKCIDMKNCDSVTQNITSFQELLGENISDPLFMEILSSLIFIHRSLLRKDVDVKYLRNELLRIKPSLSRNPDFNDVFEKAVILVSVFTI
jgi:uncharacterized protein YwgA